MDSRKSTHTYTHYIYIYITCTTINSYSAAGGNNLQTNIYRISWKGYPLQWVSSTRKGHLREKPYQRLRSFSKAIWGGWTPPYQLVEEKEGTQDHQIPAIIPCFTWQERTLWWQELLVASQRLRQSSVGLCGNQSVSGRFWATTCPEIYGLISF